MKPHLISTPRVSVVTAFLNAERFIQETIESVLAQTFSSFELILVDDGSTDASATIALEFASRHPDRVRYMTHDGYVNKGAAFSRNAGVAIARGEFIALIDADDVWTPEKLEQQVAIFDAHPTLALVAGSTIYWASWAGGRDVSILVGYPRNCVVEPPEAALTTYPLARAEAPCPSSILVRKSDYDRVGGCEPCFVGRLQLYEDQALLIKIYLSCRVYFSDKHWLYYRQHAQSCVAGSAAERSYTEVRRYFIGWLGEYMVSHSVTDPRLWKYYRKAHRRLWTLYARDMVLAILHRFQRKPA